MAEKTLCLLIMWLMHTAEGCVLDPTIMFSGNTIIQSAILALISPCGFQVCFNLHPPISCARVAGRHEKLQSAEHLFLQPTFQTSTCFIEGQTVCLCLVLHHAWGLYNIHIICSGLTLNSMPQISNQSC